MLRVLTSIAIAALISAAPLALTAGTADAAKAHQDLQAQDGERQGEDLALRHQSAVLLGRDDQLLHVRIEDARLPLGATPEMPEDPRSCFGESVRHTAARVFQAVALVRGDASRSEARKETDGGEAGTSAVRSSGITK